MARPEDSWPERDGRGDGNGAAIVEFRGGYSSSERDGVAHLLTSQRADRWWPVQRPTESKRIIGYAGHVPRDVRSARERSSAAISSAVFSTFTSEPGAK
ncbi:hypothetical protein KFE25_006896 [Diacronema lutheri]|uniref:Uncharacterized protein n=1 Tax=Diacronema lutheri TaxID=2081491 RepID=A0A8J6CCR7_DIALT|nr:hypothetical protein KFE25_006896 [Diacronema lutheri]|mmetsp:Transcript_3116/g.9683  ORF Transcript_3116/g.9683 Transcript_3116/m.9683 type:complete len:99 (+) Transcript_3116:37-333(+)